MRTDTRQRRVFRCKKKAELSKIPYSVIVVRSNKGCQVHLVGRDEGRVICGMSTRKMQGGSNKVGALELGKAFAKELADRGISRVHFNRMGFAYHGRVAAVATGLRDGGIQC